MVIGAQGVEIARLALRIPKAQTRNGPASLRRPTRYGACLDGDSGTTFYSTRTDAAKPAHQPMIGGSIVDTLEATRPASKKGPDKYSWRLYRRFKKNPTSRVYLAAWDFIYGYSVPDVEALKAGDYGQAKRLMVGSMESDGWFIGAPLTGIVYRNVMHSSMAYHGGHAIREWVDVTDWFWKRYAAIGVCILPNNHDWLTINRNSRKCARCGKHERRDVVTKKAIERRIVWSRQESIATSIGGA